MQIKLDVKSDAKSDGKTADKTADNGLDEWKAARDIFGKFDDRIADLRKWGFSFLSALITADALTKLFDSTSTYPNDRIGIAIFGITLVLIIALMVQDKNYQLFQCAAGIRTSILEARLNLELTETISFRGKMDKFNYYVLGVYLLFASVAGIIGVLYFYPDILLTLIVIIITIIAIVLIYWIGTRGPDLTRQVDWSFDRISCIQGEKIRITATNLCEKPVTFPVGKVWEIREEGKEKTATTPQTITEELTIGGQNNYSWEIPTDKLNPGIYRVFPAYLNGGLWEDPLRRAIIVQPKQ